MYLAGDTRELGSALELRGVGAVLEVVARQQRQDQRPVMAGRSVDDRALVPMPRASTRPAGHVRGIEQIQPDLEHVLLTLVVRGRAGRHSRNILEREHLPRQVDQDREVAHLVDRTGHRGPGALEHLGVVRPIQHRDDLFPGLEDQTGFPTIEDEVRAQLERDTVMRDGRTRLREGRQKNSERQKELHEVLRGSGLLLVGVVIAFGGFCDVGPGPALARMRDNAPVPRAALREVVR